MMYLLDTNVISELIAKQPEIRVIQWMQSTDEDLLYLSVITIGEIKKGIEKLPAAPRKEVLATWLQNDLPERFQHRLVPLDIDILLKWGELTARLETAGNPLPAIDSLMAASALQRELILVTRNTRDFVATGVPTLNPWIL
jgi:tRNA(fMet)-specific endonuclease VapC